MSDRQEEEDSKPAPKEKDQRVPGGPPSADMIRKYAKGKAIIDLTPAYSVGKFWPRKARYDKVRYDPIPVGQPIPRDRQFLEEGRVLKAEKNDGSSAGYDMVIAGTSNFGGGLKNKFPKLVQMIYYRNGEFCSEYRDTEKIELIKREPWKGYNREMTLVNGNSVYVNRKFGEPEESQEPSEPSEPRRSGRIAAMVEATKGPRRSKRLRDQSP